MQYRILHLLILVSITFLVWGTSLWNGFVWDDGVLIEKNEGALSPISLSTAFFSDFWSTDTENGSSNYYRPLVTLSYMLDHALYGLHPMGYHLTNVVLHTISVVTLWHLLVVLGVATGMATFAASLWAIHPAVAESVAWVSGRTDVLATVFLLLSIVIALRAYSTKRVDSRLILLSALCFGAGLLAKESAFITPLLIVVFLTLCGVRNQIDRRAVVPFAVVGAVWLLLRWMVLERAVGVESGVGASLSIGILSLLHVWGNVVWPPVFRIEYSESLTGQALLGGSLCGALLILWIVFVLAAKQGDRLTRYLYLSGLIAFIPSVMAVLLKSMIGSRLIYTSSAFVIAGFAVGLKPEGRSALWKQSVACIMVLLGALSAHRALLWRSDVRLFSAALEATDASSRNHLNLGIALYDDGDFAGALAHLSHDMDRSALDQQFYMLALLYTALECEGLAEENLSKSLEANPRYYSAAHNLAGLYASQGRYEDARTQLTAVAERDERVRARAAVQIEVLKVFATRSRRVPINPPWCSDAKALQELLRSPIGLNRLAGQHLKSGQVELAQTLVQAALRQDPWFVPARLNLAQIYVLQRDRARARATLQAILNTNPEEGRARRLLAVVDGHSQQR